MKLPNADLPPLTRIKQRAKKLKKDTGVTQSEAYTQLSEEYGFATWSDMRAAIKVAEESRKLTPPPSITFNAHDAAIINDVPYGLGTKTFAGFTSDSKILLEENKKQLTKMGIEFSIFEPTTTGLKKSILDATQTVRTHFELEQFHSYAQQLQGAEYKVKAKALFLSDACSTDSVVSLYRPTTKKGDPRMWFSKLTSFCDAGDQIAIIVDKNSLCLINLTKVSLKASLSNEKSKIRQFLSAYSKTEAAVADELLRKLKKLADKPFPALRQGDTGVGYTIETMLGIAANSSKEPDYQGIEIKTGRGTKNRTTLFAQVPKWELSPCKKSAEILNKYGYERDGDFRLYCTVSSQRENSQGLSFAYDEAKDELQEWFNKSELVAVWPGSLLRQRLKEKHSETFWVHAISKEIGGVEHFSLQSVTHTKAPMLSQLMPLLQAGVVTMDHLIKRSKKTNSVSEKGPLFKMKKDDLELLFPEPKIYELN